MTDQKEYPQISPVRLFWLKNAYVAVLLLTSFTVIMLMVSLDVYAWASPLAGHHDQYFALDLMSDILGVLTGLFFMVRHERPIRRYLDDMAAGRSLPEDQALIARRALLNEPFYLARVFFTLWLFGALIYMIVAYRLDMEWVVIRLNLSDAFQIMLVVITLNIAIMITIMQRHMAPYFFPEGRLWQVPGAITVSLKRRFTVLLVAINILPLMALIRTQFRVILMDSPPEIQLAMLIKGIWFISLFSIAMGVFLTIFVSANTTRSLTELVRVLKEVARGNYSERVEVTSNDEIGFAGDVVNEMAEGLVERDRMRRSMNMAREVQQSLIPTRTPKIPGLDLAGRIIYSEGTGGDYFDFIKLGPPETTTLSVVVGDVSDHGLPSALLMTTARASFRQRAAMSGRLANIVSDVNTQLARDIGDTGRFMTMFLCQLDARQRVVRWVNAGHDPALIYDPATDHFEELGGHSPALGVMRDYQYAELKRDVRFGQLILIGTDGLWEAQNGDGRMFGKKAYRDVIRANADRPAEELIQVVLDEIGRFSHPLTPADDITLVAIKLV